MSDGVAELVPSDGVLHGILESVTGGSRFEQSIAEGGQLANGGVAGARTVDDLGVAPASRYRQRTAERGAERIKRGIGEPSAREA